MTDNRIYQHPILEIKTNEQAGFFWKGNPFKGKSDEPISSAMIANGIFIFGQHPRDHSPQSIFCANGQCSQCMVMADGFPVKSCITALKDGMKLEPVEGLISLPRENKFENMQPIEELEVPVLIIGGGPAGLSAALELSRENIQVLLIDDKPSFGGKLVLQTHRFFGSTDAVYAGTRGIEIAQKLFNDVSNFSSFTGWTNSTALAVFSDKKLGILKNGTQYVLVKAKHILIATGAREKSLCFPGNTLPGVLGAGAFQTLVNRDLVLPGRQICIIGGGNVGLIAGYHALQAGISLAGLIELMADCSGYKVHQDNLKRLGVPFFLSHTILSANGDQHVESITIANVDGHNLPIANTEKNIPCDCLLISVGLNPVDEFYKKGIEFGMSVEAAGDAEEIAEASAAMISGKIKAIKIMGKYKGKTTTDIAPLIYLKEMLASRPGLVHSPINTIQHLSMFPVLHCFQEIPCDPCAALCPLGLISIDQKNIRSIPSLRATNKECSGCMRCVAGCPGHAITLVDCRADGNLAFVSLSYEFGQDSLKQGDFVAITNIEGDVIGNAPIIRLVSKKAFSSTKVVTIQVKKEIASQVVGYRIQNKDGEKNIPSSTKINESDNIICRCERITKEEILNLIRVGHRDLNEIKALTRAGMGACGGKTCQNLILQLMKQEDLESQAVPQTSRPLFCETPLAIFAGIKGTDNSNG